MMGEETLINKPELEVEPRTEIKSTASTERQPTSAGGEGASRRWREGLLGGQLHSLSGEGAAFQNGLETERMKFKVEIHTYKVTMH